MTDILKEGQPAADTTKSDFMAGQDPSGNLKRVRVTADGHVITTAGGASAAFVDDAAFTPGTSSVTMAGAMFDDVAPDSVNEGDGGAVRMSANRNLYTTLRDAAGNERGANVDASNQLSVVDSAVKTAVEVMDDWDEGDRAKVNTIAGQEGIAGGQGLMTALTTRVTIATDDLIVDDIDAIQNFANSIDGNAALAAASLIIMDDWDESDRAKVNIIVGQAGITAGAGAVAANTPRVTLASDDPAVSQLSTLNSKIGAPSGVLVSRQIDVDESFDLITSTNDSRIISIHAFNTHATDLRYLKIYNDEAPDETDTPIFTFPLSPRGGFLKAENLSFVFTVGIAVRATTGVADNDTGAPGDNEVVVNIEYI